MSHVVSQLFSDGERRRFIRARIVTANSKGLRYMKTNLVTKLRHGWVSRELYDFTVAEIDKRLVELGCSGGARQGG